MSYNRWIESDYLAHHGVKGQVWGHKNGPPYPLSRQEKFHTVGPDGRPITSKVAYKKAQKNVRAANRAERKANPNGTPQDKEERNSFGAQVKRKYRQYKRDQKAKAIERERQEAEEKKNWDKAEARLKKSGIPEDIARRMVTEALGYDPKDRIPGQHWGPRFEDPKYKLDTTGISDKDSDSEALNKLIDNYKKNQKAEQIAQKAARDAAKEHGTAEEVMKYRDTFNKDEWNEIAGRLEAEARVKKLLDRPLDSANSNQNQGKSQNNSQQSSSKNETSSGLSGKLKKIAEKGDAREVYQNRSKFTPEQLQTISRRLQAEETIAKFADNQLLFKSDALRNLENIARYAQTAGNIATGVSNVVKAFSGGGGDGKNKNKGNNGGGGQQSNRSKSSTTTTTVNEYKNDKISKSTTTTKNETDEPYSWWNRKKK